MKKQVLMIAVVFFSLSLFGQKYARILNQGFTLADLEYMPLSELRLLKNELIATKGSDIIRSNKDSLPTLDQSPQPFLDDRSEKNLQLITKLEYSLSKTDSVCTDLELYHRFIGLIDEKQKIPFYLQAHFLGACQDPTANIYLVPVSDYFYTIGISKKPMVGPESHRIITMSQEGKIIDSKFLHGKAQFKNDQIIHESFNSLIEYTYQIDDQGKFDKKTPTKTRE